MKTIIILLIIYAVVKSCDGCSCMRADPVKHYCGAQFVARLTIGDRNIVSRQKVYYDFTDLKVLRATKRGRQSLQNMKLWTAASSSMCGMRFEEEEVYLITGDVDQQNNPIVNLCNYSTLWEVLTIEQKRGFSGDYKNKC